MYLYVACNCMHQQGQVTHLSCRTVTVLFSTWNKSMNKQRFNFNLWNRCFKMLRQCAVYEWPSRKKGPPRLPDHVVGSAFNSLSQRRHTDIGHRSLWQSWQTPPASYFGFFSQPIVGWPNVRTPGNRRSNDRLVVYVQIDRWHIYLFAMQTDRSMEQHWQAYTTLQIALLFGRK